MRKTTLLFTILAAMFLLLTTSVYADVPHMIRFQGKVTDKAGAPLEGSYNITFRVYNSETGGTLMWSETQSAAPVNNGIFTVLLGNVTPLDLPFDQPYWLSMEVSDDGEMEPRQRITSVGYAYYAEKAKTIDGVSVVPQGAIILWRGTSCPVGYSPVNDLQGKFLVAKAEGETETTGGSNTHTHGAGSYSGPSHTHSYSGTSGAPSSTSGCSDEGGACSRSQVTLTHTHSYSGTTGASGTGAVTGTSTSADSRPEFVTVLLCEKD